ncbi:HNH endonuclease signature motif containing protein, partial [Skermania piniformis]
YLGRSKRLASPDQRIVATARYGGCSFPACARPALDCEYHHTTAWAEGGCTDVTNLAPVCGHHHGLADHGWAVHHDEYGRIEWLPPAWLDPHRTPRTNTYHRPIHWYHHPTSADHGGASTAVSARQTPTP